MEKKRLITIVVVSALLLTAPIPASAGSPKEVFRYFDVKEEWLVKDVSLDEAEQEIAKLDIESPHFLNEWEWFKSQVVEGDEIWYFNTPYEMWHALYGANGYVLIRNGKQICTFVMAVS